MAEESKRQTEKDQLPDLNRSEQIKLELINSFLDFIEKIDSEDCQISIEEKQIIAAALISVLSYGYNVDNRRPMPSHSGVFKYKESGKHPRGLDLRLEGLYRRSNQKHPSRYLIDKLREFFPKSNDIPREDKLGDSQLGQWVTPEEVYERVFESATTKEIITFSSEMLKAEKCQLAEFRKERKEAASSDSQSLPLPGTDDTRPNMMLTAGKDKLAEPSSTYKNIASMKNIVGKGGILEQKSTRSRMSIATHELPKITKEKILSMGLEFGSAYSEGDCFFDSIAQGLSEAAIKIPTKNEDQTGCKSLRELCRKYALDIKNRSVLTGRNWVKEAIKGEQDDYNQYLLNVRFTHPEIQMESAEKRIHNNIAIWGRQHIEGRMIAEKLDISLHFIEIQKLEGKLIEMHQMVDASSSKSVSPELVNYNDPSVIHIVVYNLHFVPLLKRKRQLRPDLKVSPSTDDTRPDMMLTAGKGGTAEFRKERKEADSSDSQSSSLPPSTDDTRPDMMLTAGKGGTAEFRTKAVKTDSIDSQSSSLPASTYDKMLDKKRSIVNSIAEKIKDRKEGQYVHVLAPPNGYPCVMFDLRRFLIGSELESIKWNKLPGGPNLENLQGYGRFVISCFIGLINYHSIKKYGENFIYVQEQASFGSLRPSFSDTGKSIRFSPGYVPDDFGGVVADAYKDLVETFKDLKKKYLKSSDNSRNLQQLYNHFTLKDSSYKTEDAQLLFLNMWAHKTSSDNFLEKFINKAFEMFNREIVESQPSELDKIEEEKPFLEFLKRREYSFTNAYEQIIKQAKRKKATAPTELLALLNDLLKLHSSLSDQGLSQQSSLFYSFSGAITTKIEEIISEANDDAEDFSKVTWTIETLLRLFKLRYELMFRHAPLNQTILGRSISNGTDHVSRTRCGMSSIAYLIRFLKEQLGDDEFKVKISDTYFEVGRNLLFKIFGTRGEGGFRRKAQRKFYNKYIVTDAGSSEIAETILITDLNPIPQPPFAQMPATAMYYFSKDGSDIVERKTTAKIVIVDTTVATEAEIRDMLDKFKSQQNIEILITFASNNKTGVVGTCLTSMGEIRLFNKDSIAPEYADIFDNLSSSLATVKENSIGQQAYRQLLTDLQQRPSLLDEGKRLHQGSSSPALFPRAHSDAVPTAMNPVTVGRPNGIMQALNTERASSSPAPLPAISFFGQTRSTSTSQPSSSSSSTSTRAINN
jgi:hypothetical protein